jgi:hypothetical protein
MKTKAPNTDKIKLRNLIKEVITEQTWSEEEVGGIPVSFTDEDRMMLKMIYDVVVMGGAAGGYGGARKRSLTALGSLPIS